MATKKTDQIEVRPINKQIIEITIKGTTPLIVHAWSEKAKREMLAHRGNKTWTRQNAEDMAARTILGMTLVFGKKSFEEQAKYEKEETLRNALAKIKRDPTFRRMMQNEGVMKIADKVIIGNSSITNAFFNAKHQLDAPQQAQQNAAQPVAFQPAESMDKAAKKELWERNPLQL